MKPRKAKNMINREKYKEIKKFDHHQMEEFAAQIYLGAYEDGAEAAKNEENKAVESLLASLELGECRGIRKTTIKKMRDFAGQKGLLPVSAGGATDDA